MVRGEEPIGFKPMEDSVGLKVDVSKIETKEQASRLIDRLKLLNHRMNGTTVHDDSRDRRVAFGMATKLFFTRYSDQQKWKQFWKDGHTFYRQYLQAGISDLALGLLHGTPSPLLNTTNLPPEGKHRPERSVPTARFQARVYIHRNSWGGLLAERRSAGR